ncbi:MAG: PAS domain-containing protein [Crocinitomicaceae bacterium]|nr:PAS domain-containing protein [Crocinitomicaceae bacterium]MBK8926273.1 PAS domain-containing protein [Crocinitomicaceae bacterium]
MSTDQFVLRSACQIWTNQNMQAKQIRQDIDFDLQKKLLNMLSVGDYYVFIFNLADLKFDYVSDDVERVLGYKAEEFTMPFILSKIHPDDRNTFVNFENTVMNFFKKLPQDQYFNYKMRYDYRVMRSDGTYARILQQVITINYSIDGGVIHTFGVHTDISHLKTSNHTRLSFIGLNGAPSFLDYPVEEYKSISPTVDFTKRELDILSLMWEGMDTHEIAAALQISSETVKTMRKKMLAKTNSPNAVSLVRYALEHGAI